jgi:transcriptional regulator with XRE-family HTH domain
MDADTITDRLIDAFRAAETDGLTQADLARRCGVSRATVNDWLKGRAVSIKPPHLFAVADALGIEARWLATGQGPRHCQRLSADQQRLIQQYHVLSDTERAAVRGLVYQLAEPRAEYKP